MTQIIVLVRTFCHACRKEIMWSDRDETSIQKAYCTDCGPTGMPDPIHCFTCEALLGWTNESESYFYCPYCDKCATEKEKGR